MLMFDDIEPPQRHAAMLRCATLCQITRHAAADAVMLDDAITLIAIDADAFEMPLCCSMIHTLCPRECWFAAAYAFMLV